MDTKKIKKILAKLGIFRSGFVTWKGDAKNRPIEIIDDGVYKKDDFTTKEDIKNVSNKLPKDRLSIVFTAIAILNIILILILVLGVGFNFGTVLSIALLIIFRKMYLSGKLVSVITLLGAGTILTIAVFLSIALLSNTEDVQNDSQDISSNSLKSDVGNNNNEKDEVILIFEEVLSLTGVSEEIEDDVLVKPGNSGAIYLKGKGIGARDVNSDLIRKINPLMQEMGFAAFGRGEITGTPQVGGESFQRDNIYCDIMGNTYSTTFNEATSSFSFNCAYIEDSASSYMEALEIELTY